MVLSKLSLYILLQSFFSNLGWLNIDKLRDQKLITIEGSNEAMCRCYEGGLYTLGVLAPGGGCGPAGTTGGGCQVLVDLHSMARWQWRPWDVFTQLHVGTVAVHEKARHYIQFFL